MASSSRLTDDNLLEIFTHLPLNSIYKFKCLPKVWLFNLSNPTFIIKWLKLNNKSLPWIQYYEHEVADENRLIPMMAYPELHSEFISRNQHLFSFKFLMNQEQFEGGRLTILGSSNGLVLCSINLYPRKENVSYHVCNPLTQKWVSLPSKIRGFGVSGIFCEYSSSFPNCSYKVISIPEFETPSKKFNIDVFSSDLGVWESFQVSSDRTVGWGRFNNVVTLNGFLFWYEDEGKILVYNLNQKNGSNGHQCSLIDLPDIDLDVNEFRIIDGRIGESEGCVCYAEIGWTAGRMTVNVWVLNEVNWQILQRNISLDDVYAELFSRISKKSSLRVLSRIGKKASLGVLGFSPLDRNVILLGWKHWIWMFNIQTKSFEELCLDYKHVRRDADMMILPVAVKPMPTVLPLPSG